MINKPSLFWGLNIRIPIIPPIKGRGFINEGSTLMMGGSWVERLRIGVGIRGLLEAPCRMPLVLRATKHAFFQGFQYYPPKGTLPRFGTL